MRYGATTDAPGPDVIRRAVQEFGAGGIGLQMVEHGMTSARFESTLGHIGLEVSRTPDARTEVTIETREYDNEVQAFITSLPRHSAIRRMIDRFRR